MNEQPKTGGDSDRGKEPPPARVTNALARTPTHWFSLGEVEGVRRIEGLTFDWPGANPLDGVDPYLAWLDVSRFLGTDLGKNNGTRLPDTVPMLVKVSTAEGALGDGGGFGMLVVPRKACCNCAPAHRFKCSA
jgi:hypothetical protein